MLEPNVKSVVTNSTKPVEITLDSESKVHLKTEELIVPTTTTSNINETSSYSAYASAESSPNQNSLLANAESTTHLRMKQTSATSSNSSLSSYLTIDNSKLIDDLASAISGRETPTNKPTEPFYEITTEQVNKNYLDDEFQSLPPSFMDEMKLIKTSEQINFNLIENDLVNVNLKPKESVSLILNKEVCLQLNDLDSSLNEKSNPPTPTPTNTSPFQKSSIKTTAMAFLNLFKTDKPQETKPELPKSTEMNKSKSANFSTSLHNDHNLSAKLATNAITSASSPNPDCSPYKLLLNELPSNKTVVINDFNSRTNKTQTEEHKDSTQQYKPSHNNLIESLASLNQKESDKIDPILSSASKNVPQSSVQQQEEKKKTESLSSQTETKPNNDTKVDHVPASSHEFCMNLNFNLAAAAAATAAGPVVVVDNLKTSPDHIRFTSNASTSSIHNDLKLILEESKEQTHKGILDSPPQSGNKKLNKSNQQQPKPQRAPKNKSEKKTESSDADSLNLIKAMMLMAENKKHQLQQDKPVISWPKKENGRFRYSKEFLQQINEQRSEFIDQIYPDIFKAYCYCMNGKYWDPEKYFDIVQFPGEFDKLATRSISNSNNNSRSNNNYNSYSNNKQQNYQRKRNNSNSKYDYNNKSRSGDLLTPSTSVLSHNESPQPLQVPKNSPKVTHQHDSHTQHVKNSLNLSTNSQKYNKENKKKLTNILSTLGFEQQVKTTQADKMLLDLIKNKEQPAKCNDLLEILNSKKEQFDRRPTNILENLFPGKTSPQQQVVPQLTPQAPKHFPQVLTAQELEMSQLLTQQKQNNHKLPINQSEIIRFDDLNNTSDAYKQLVKNLSNHPLNSPLSTSNIMSKLQHEQKTKQLSNNGTNVLRQLLNLNPEAIKHQPEKKTSNKKKNSNHNHHTHHNKTKSPSTSMLTSDQIESMEFPATIPHEKPFETFLNEETQHVEKVIASTLNHVLYKNPQQTTQTKNTIENLFQQINSQQLRKKNNKSESDHFNTLLNKMMPIVDKKTETTSSDILKWFTGNQTTSQTATSFSPQALSEIEFMELHHPKVLNKLY